MQNSMIGVSNLPNLIHNEFTLRGCNFNIMVVGGHGLGKTTFVRKFLETSVIQMNPFENMKGSDTFWTLEAKCNIQTSSIEIRESGFSIKLNITEVDGVGDCVDNTECYKPIIDLLESNFKRYYEKFKEQTRRTIDDERVHVCFYFLEPIFSVKKPDLETLKHISSHCTVVPIIAKSDLVGRDELPELKNHIREILYNNGIPFFEDETLQARAPFALFSEMRDGDASQVNWAAVGLNTQANDFAVVKRLVIERHALMLIRQTDQFYDNYRISRLLANSGDSSIMAKKEAIEKKIKEYQAKLETLHKHQPSVSKVADTLQ